MSSILQIAAKVEAAMEAYASVRDFVDKWEWKKMFRGKLVSAHLYGI